MLLDFSPLIFFDRFIQDDDSVASRAVSNLCNIFTSNLLPVCIFDSHLLRLFSRLLSRLLLT